MGTRHVTQLFELARREWEESGMPASQINFYLDVTEQERLSKTTLEYLMGELQKEGIQTNIVKEMEVLSSKPKNRIEAREDQSSESLTHPPLNAEFLLHLLLRHDEHDAIIGDLIERYGKKCTRLGTRRANIWFYAEVFWTALPLIKRAFLKISGIMTLAEFVRRHIS